MSLLSYLVPETLPLDIQQKCSCRGPANQFAPFFSMSCFDPAYSTQPTPNNFWTTQYRFGQAFPEQLPNQTPYTGDNNPLWVRTQQGQIVQVMPLKTRAVNPQCSTCLKTTFLCNRFRSAQTADPNYNRIMEDNYQKCKAMESCFVYDVQRSDGTIIEVGVKNDPSCKACAISALKQCAERCGSCQTCFNQ